MVIFYSYVSLPEGTLGFLEQRGCGKPMVALFMGTIIQIVDRKSDSTSISESYIISRGLTIPDTTFKYI